LLVLWQKTFGINRLETSGYQRYNGDFSEQNYDLILTFKKDFGKDFNLTTCRRHGKKKCIQFYHSFHSSLIVPIVRTRHSLSTSPCI
jgi:hypothetical protein